MTIGADCSECDSKLRKNICIEDFMKEVKDNKNISYISESDLLSDFIYETFEKHGWKENDQGFFCSKCIEKAQKILS